MGNRKKKGKPGKYIETETWKKFFVPPLKNTNKVEIKNKSTKLDNSHFTSKERKKTLISAFREILIDALIMPSSDMDSATIIEEAILETKTTYTKLKTSGDIFTLKYKDPETNPFRFIFHKRYP